MSHKDLSYEELKSLGADEFQSIFIQRRIEKYGTDDLREVNNKNIPHIEKTYQRCADIFKSKRNYFLKLHLSTRDRQLKKQYLHMANVYSDCLLVLTYQSQFARDYCEWVMPKYLK